MFGGRIKYSQGKTVKDSYKQYAYQDVWENEYPIEYDGEFTPEVVKAIQKAFTEAPQRTRSESSWGRLRWSQDEIFDRVDTERRVLISIESTGIAD